eukprot:803886-Amphidinium_carterae.1
MQFLCFGIASISVATVCDGISGDSGLLVGVNDLFPWHGIIFGGRVRMGKVWIAAEATDWKPIIMETPRGWSRQSTPGASHRQWDCKEDQN